MKRVKSVNILMTRNIRLLLVVVLTLLVIVIVISLPPIPQDQDYNRFADQRKLFSITNFFDVISNIPFFLIGIMGLIFLWKKRGPDDGVSFIDKLEKLPYVFLFSGLLLTCFGSIYYHLSPDNARLLLDRLPMSIIFMSFFSAIISERIDVKAGFLLLFSLVALGIGSVIYWYLSELKGLGDLRPYIIVQFYPGLAIPLIIFLFPPRYTRSIDLIITMIFYALAKVFEVLDKKIFSLVDIVSGHTLKHLTAAFAAYWILRMLKKRRSFIEELK